MKKNSGYLGKIVIISFILSVFTFAQNLNLPQGVSVYQLDNGIELMLIEKPSLPMVGINTVVKVGSAYESFATSGMSHMLEHLLFNGTDSMTQKELYDAVDLIGGYNNANTSEYYTNFMMVTPADNIEEGMKIQAAMLFDSILPEEKFEKEKGIVLEEIAKSLANQRAQAERNVRSIIYSGHALSLPTLGTYETIKHMSRDEVYEFYKNYYVPNNMIITVIGNFNSAKMLKSIKAIYGSRKPGNVIYPSNANLKTGFDKINTERIAGQIYHRFYSGKKLKVEVLYPICANTSSQLLSLAELYFSKRTDYYKEQINKKFKDVIGNISFSFEEAPVAKYAHLSLELDNGTVTNEIVDYLNGLVGQEKIEISPSQVKTEAIKARTRFLKNTEKPHMFGIYNAEILAVDGISAIFKTYSGEEYFKAGKQLKDFTLNNVKPVVIVQHPKIEESTSSGLKMNNAKLFDGIENGPVVIAKENPGSDLLAIHYLIKYKSAYESKYGKYAAQILHDAFGQRMKSDKVVEVSSEYGLNFTVNDNPFIPMDNIYLDESFGYIRVEGLGDNIKSVIEFLNKQMLNFKPTEAEYKQALSSVKMAAMMQRRENPAKQKFNSLIDSVLYSDPGYNIPDETASYDNILKFAEEYFVPTNMIISVVSKEQAETVSAYFDKFTKAAPANSLSGRGYYKTFKRLEKPVNIEVNANGEQAYLYYGFQQKISEDEKAALKALSLLLSDRIVFDIREKQGMAYRMSAGIEMIDDLAMFYINMGTRPENVEKLIPQFPGFFNEEFKETINEKDLVKAVNMYLGRMMFRRLSSINQAYYLGNSYYFHEDIEYDSKALSKLKNVKVEDVIRVAEKYLHPENEVRIIVK